MLRDIFERNADWAEDQVAGDPGYFNRLATQQTPEFFWIGCSDVRMFGCSDSRVPANVVCELEPGEVFVHRDVANIIHSFDFNMLSALEYAVDGLREKHVIVCGHYGCGGVHASVEDCPHGLVDHWLEPMRPLADQYLHELVVLDSKEARLNRLAELNVIEAVGRVSQTPILRLLRRAWDDGLDVGVHGIIYGLKDGRIRDLACSVVGGLQIESEG